MAEYIDREKIISEACGNCTRQVDLLCRHPEPCGKLIDAFLTPEAADVAPVVHAQWKQISEPDEDGDVWYRCTACSSNDLHSPGIDVPYCWHCGAKMDAAEPRRGAD